MHRRGTGYRSRICISLLSTVICWFCRSTPSICLQTLMNHDSISWHPPMTISHYPTISGYYLVHLWFIIPICRKNIVREEVYSVLAVVLVVSPTPHLVWYRKKGSPTFFCFTVTSRRREGRVHVRLYSLAGMDPNHTTAKKRGILSFYCSMHLSIHERCTSASCRKIYKNISCGLELFMFCNFEQSIHQEFVDLNWAGFCLITRMFMWAVKMTCRRLN